MAKVTNTERVSPITRANYTGSLADEASDVAHDPLAALAKLVGNIENDAAHSNEPAASELNFDLESELIRDFNTADDDDNGVHSHKVDFSDIENELSMALGTDEPVNSGVDQTPHQEPDYQQGQHVPAHPDPVLQSFESLHVAFGVAPEAGEPMPAQPDPVQVPVIDPSDLAIEEQLLRELSIDPAPVYSLSEPVEPVEQYSAPVAETNFASTDYVQQPIELVGANIETGPTLDEGGTAEFEAAMAGSAAELFGQPQVGTAQEIEVNAPIMPEVPQAAEIVDENNPFGTLAEAVTMPPVSTPFDHQVDDALSDILTEAPKPEDEFGWSGDLAGELENIVSSSSVSDSGVVTPAPNVRESPLAEPHYETVSNEFFTEETATPQVASEAGGFQSDPVDTVEFSAFERELADQLNPNVAQNIDDDPYVAIPEAPEFMEDDAQKRRGFGVAVGVLGIAAVVAAGAFGWNYFSNEEVGGPVPVIMASTEPVKIKPKEPGGVEIPNQDQVVFQKVNGNSEDKTSQERLASGAETPIRVITTNSIPPVVQPLPLVSSDPTAAKSSARLSPNDTILVRTEQAIISPRKVRTVVVRPDGTIVSAKQSVSPAKKAKIEPVRVASVNKEASFAQPVGETTRKTPPVVAALPTSSAPKPISAPKIKIVSVRPVNVGVDKLRTASTPVAKTAPKPVAIVPVKKVKVQPINKASAPKKVKPVSKPVKLASASTGGYVMQISSQRSAEAAQTSYNRLNKRFSGILGGKGVDIRRFKLKDKGIYYRVRIPAGSKKSAINLCTRYKSAGGSCFVTR